MNTTFPTRVLGGLLLGLALLLALARPGLAAEACDPVIGNGHPGESCSASYVLVGNQSALDGYAISESAPATITFTTAFTNSVGVTSTITSTIAIPLSVDNAQLSSFGALLLEDYLALEAEAHRLLAAALETRKSISPYRGNNQYDALVRQFDGASNQPTNIEAAEGQLVQARNIYAYLAVFAPEAAMRAHPDLQVRCGKPENPNPEDPTHSGQVLEPVIDWCDFDTRLRQSVREAANLRMIYAQEFMVDAVGQQFGSNLVGGEERVNQEIAQLQAALYQYDRAGTVFDGALKHKVGSGCRVSDFFAQPEWSLLARISENRATAQQLIGMRKSYLGVDTPAQVETAKAEAEDAMRDGATENYLMLVGMAGEAAANASDRDCGALGTRPDGDALAELATTLVETQLRTNELRDGRNVFGFDVTFTPARPFFQEGQQEGLWNEAKELAETALENESTNNTDSRNYDLDQAALRQAILDLQTTLYLEISADLSCTDQPDPNNPGDTGGALEMDSCVETQLTALETCQTLVGKELAGWNSETRTVPELTSEFDGCMEEINDGGTAKEALYGVRAAFLAQYSILKQAVDVYKRIQLSKDADATVTKWLTIKGVSQTAVDVAAAALDATDPGTVLDVDVTRGRNVAMAANVVLIGANGAISTQADIEVAGAENKKEIENLLLDMAELMIDADAARQEFNSALHGYLGVTGHITDVAREAKRQRDYLLAGPGNDPSYRMMRDANRLRQADDLVEVATLSYLAARRAEYEYVTVLSDPINGVFRISDIYRARTAQDVIDYLNELKQVTNNLPTDLERADFTLSVAQHVLNLTDAVLIAEGFTTPEAIEAERVRRFRQWVKENTRANDFVAPFDNKPVLSFTLPTSVNDGGIWWRLQQQSYANFWLHRMAGVSPTTTGRANGLSVNLRTDEPGLDYRAVVVTQSGLTHLRSEGGCIFDYRLINPRALRGESTVNGQDPSIVTAAFRANVNEEHSWDENGYRTPRFQGYPISSTAWEVLVKAGADDATLPDMDLEQLTDIELNFSTTYASRQPSDPDLAKCNRIDY